MKPIMLILIAVLLTGCGLDQKQAEDPGPQTVKLQTQDGVGRTQTTRFTVEKVASFNAGYDDARRDIFILHDSVTGDNYIGVTDCTLIKAVNKKRQESADTALEIINTAISTTD